MFTFASSAQEQLHSAVREARRKVIAVTTVIHQADGQARQEMVQNAWQEQRCSVLNKPDGLNHLSDWPTTSFVQDSFVKTIKKHFKRQIRLTLLSVCSFEKAISAYLGRIHLVIFHDVHQALKFLPPNKFPRQSSKDTHTHTKKIATHKEQWNLRWNLYFWGIQPLDVLLNSSFNGTGLIHFRYLFMPGNLQPIRIPVSGFTSVAFTHLSWHSSKQIAAKQISEAKLKDTRIKYARTKNANAKNFVFKGGSVGANRLPGNGTLKTKEKETRNLVVRAMPFILNFRTQKSSC